MFSQAVGAICGSRIDSDEVSCAADKLPCKLKSKSFDSQDLVITTYLQRVLGRLEGVPAGETAICQVSLIRARRLKRYTVIKSWPGIEKTAVCDRSSQDYAAEFWPHTFSHVNHDPHYPMAHSHRLLEFSDSSVMLQQLERNLGLSVLMLCVTAEIRVATSEIAGISHQSLYP